MTKVPLLEEAMLQPVLSLFPASTHRHCKQFPLGRKKIDLICVEQAVPNSVISIELKISDWRKALWQASVNRQLAHRSYVAIWHEYVHRAAKEFDLFNAYNVGLIAVYPEKAEILIESKACPRRVARHEKCDWYKQLMSADSE